MAKWLAAFAIVLTLQSSAAAAQPNVVLIMADDFGYECVTANGGQSYQTPNIDQLATTGMRFEHCHVQPLCTPTRVQLMTGRLNVRNYLNFGKLLRSETTFAHHLKRAGYATGICGKWQLGREKDSPQHFGFDESCLWQHTRRPARYANPGLEYDGVARDFKDGEYGPDLVNEWAVDFIQRHRNKPFFLYYPMILTHDPFQPTPDSSDWDPGTTGENAKQDVKHFADMTAYMDTLIGRLMGRLDTLKIRDNTLVLFLGDNGTSNSVTSRFAGTQYRGGKGTTTRRGTHVPLIANWPAVIQAGQVNSDLIGSTDFLPTVLQAAGVAVPTDTDGVSFLSQLEGKPGTPRSWIYSWYSPRQKANLAVREFAWDHRYKLYRGGEFYDLTSDPDEQNPLALASLSGEAAATAQRLDEALEQFEGARPEELDREFERSITSQPDANSAPRDKKKGKT